MLPDPGASGHARQAILTMLLGAHGRVPAGAYQNPVSAASAASYVPLPPPRRAPVLAPPETGLNPGQVVMTTRNGQPVYYGTPQAAEAALEGLHAVKTRYGVRSARFRAAVLAALGVLGPMHYQGPNLETWEAARR